MQCPVCQNTQLVMSERQGIEIDYCPQCRGVWLDRGELDKIIERSAAPAQAESVGRQAPPPQPYPDQRSHPQQSYPQQGGHGYYKDDYRSRKKKGFLGELFDFD